MNQKAYDNVVQHINDAAKTVFNIICQKAVNEEKELNIQNGRPTTNLKISGDESWKTRGFTSLYGVTTLIRYYSGKVVNLIVKGSFYDVCAKCNKKEGTCNKSAIKTKSI